MVDEVKVILDLSDEVQSLLERQDTNLYEEIQRECPSIRLALQVDPEAVPGSKDLVQVITVTTGLVGALTPIILQLLKLLTPPNRSVEWIIEETETRNVDGSTTIHRKRVLSRSEQRPQEQQAEKVRGTELPPPQEKQDQA